MENIFEFLDRLDAIDTIENIYHVFRRPRVYRVRPDFFAKYDDVDFFRRYRLSKESVRFLLEKIAVYLEFPSRR